MASIRETIMSNLFDELTGYKETGELDIRDVSRFDEDMLTANNWQSPFIMIMDVGDDELRVQDDTHYRYRFNIVFHGYVRADTAIDLQPLLNRLMSVIKQFIDSVPSLGTNVLSLQYLNNEPIRLDKNSGQGDCQINARLTYWCLNGTF